MYIDLEELLLWVHGDRFTFTIWEKKNGSKRIEVLDAYEESVANEKKIFEIDNTRRGCVYYNTSNEIQIDRMFYIPVVGSPAGYVLVRYSTPLAGDRESGHFTVFDNNMDYLVYNRGLVDVNRVVIQKMEDIIEKRVIPDHSFRMAVPEVSF